MKEWREESEKVAKEMKMGEKGMDDEREREGRVNELLEKEERER